MFSAAVLYLSVLQCLCLCSAPVPCTPPSQLAAWWFYVWLEVSPKQDHVFHGKCCEVIHTLDEEPGEMDFNFVSFLPLSLNFSLFKMVVMMGRGGMTKQSLRSFWTMVFCVSRFLTWTGSSLKIGEVGLLSPLDSSYPIPMPGRGLWTFIND